MEPQKAPVLSTPAENVLEFEHPVEIDANGSTLSEEQLYVQYEIKRTVAEIRAGKWRRIALQFPDDMLVDAPRVFERLRDGLKAARKASQPESNPSAGTSLIDLNNVEENICILADTSYGACCVDEVAAEHVSADVIVHYGRSCLSPTARLPVIYVFTSRPLDTDAVLISFQSTYPDKHEKVCLMADIPYNHHLSILSQQLGALGYTNIFQTDLVRDPTSPLPNRTVPEKVRADSTRLADYYIFHISTPPTALLLVLSSKVKGVHIYDPSRTSPTQAATLESSTSRLLRRRYALITRLATAAIFGILINTLSVSDYMQALSRCQELITRAGKKSYVFVVGKVNAAKVANFSEVGGWVVIGCWESSLMESRDFYRPIITPFELEVALTDDKDRVWGGEWIADFSALLAKDEEVSASAATGAQECGTHGAGTTGNWEEQASDDEPPEFDLRTGRYVSQSRPMGRPKASKAAAVHSGEPKAALPSSALVHRAKGEVAAINGQVSPAAEFLRSNRTWQGLGSDYEIAYERDDQGRIRGAAMEEGRSGVAKGYTVGEQDATRH